MADSLKNTARDVREAKEACIFNFNDVPVKVIVGPSKEAFYVMPSVLVKLENFFDLALQEPWKEGQDRTIPLPDGDPTIFRLYAGWLYTGNIFSKSEGSTTARDYDTLIGLYILGEKLLDRKSKDRVIDAMLATAEEANKAGGQIRIPDYPRIYKSTPTTSPIHTLMVD